MTENKITRNSRLIDEQGDELSDRREKEVALQKKITDTDWSDIYAPVITFDGEQYQLVYQDMEPTHDPGESNYYAEFTHPNFPNLTFHFGFQGVGHEEYEPDEGSKWEIDIEEK